MRDISHPEHEAQRVDVEHVLQDLGIETGSARRPRCMEVWNKIDRLDAQAARGAGEHGAAREPTGRSWSRRVTGEGVEALLAAIDERLGEKQQRC